jgi:hypothetical protein
MNKEELYLETCKECFHCNKKSCKPDGLTPFESRNCKNFNTEENIQKSKYSEEEKWEFEYINIDNMINDYHKLSIGNEELRNHVYNYIEKAIHKSSHNLTSDEIWELITNLNK